MQHGVERLLVGAERESLEAPIDFSFAVDPRQNLGDGIVRALEIEIFRNVAFKHLPGSIQVHQGWAVLVADPEVSCARTNDSLGVEAVRIEGQKLLRGIVVRGFVLILEIGEAGHWLSRLADDRDRVQNFDRFAFCLDSEDRRIEFRHPESAAVPSVNGNLPVGATVSHHPKFIARIFGSVP